MNTTKEIARVRNNRPVSLSLCSVWLFGTIFTLTLYLDAAVTRSTDPVFYISQYVVILHTDHVCSYSYLICHSRTNINCTYMCVSLSLSLQDDDLKWFCEENMTLVNTKSHKICLNTNSNYSEKTDCKTSTHVPGKGVGLLAAESSRYLA